MKEEKESAVTPQPGPLYLLSALTKEAGALDELKKFVTDAGATVVKAEDLGSRKLAFPINKHAELTLVSVFFSADGAASHALQEALRHEEWVERFLVTTWNASPDQPVRAARSKKYDV